MKLESLTAVGLGKLVNSRTVSAVEVIQYFHERYLAHNSKVNAFTYEKFEEALETAKHLDIAISRNKLYCGPFAGVPVALKDFLPSKTGWKNSHGGVPCLVQTDGSDSMFYKAASSLGAIAVGKTNCPAFGFSGACSNKMYGATTNPFNPNYTSGGSSGGTAAAVASGLILLGEGGDAGGSIRIPSGWCNLFGFKPSLGTVPSYCRPDGWSATHPYCFNGCLTKSVEDSAYMLNEMAVYNPRDPISLPINSSKDFVALMNKPVAGMKVALTFDFGAYVVDSEVKSIVDLAAYRLTQAGVKVDLVDINFNHSIDEIMQCWAWSISVDTAIDLAHWKEEGLDIEKDHTDEVPEEFLKFNRIASQATIFDMREFNEIRTDILDTFEDVFDDYDFIISPTAACPPLPNEWNGRVKEIAGVKIDDATSFISFGETPFANFIGYPAASVPAGLTKKGLPVGMQIIGKQYHDEDVLALSHASEEIQPWYKYYDLSIK